MDPTTLPPSGTCELTTTGRRSGRRSRIDIWYVVAEGHLVVTGTPGRRDWLANLRADARARLHLAAGDVDVVAHEVTDPEERRALFREVWRVQPWYSRQEYSLDAWVERAPLVVLHEAGTRAA